MAESVKRKSMIKKTANPAMTPNTSGMSSISNVKDGSTDLIENYHLEYGKYLLRKVQNRVLSDTKGAKEENIKKCLISLKLEYEELLDINVTLRRDVKYFKAYYKTLNEIIKKIEEGEDVMKAMRETEFDNYMNTLTNLFNCSLNQLQLVDIDKNLIDDAFREKIWGSGSELEDCLKKIESFLCENKVQVSKISAEVSEIRKLASENTIMRERFNYLFKNISKEIVETNYKLFSGTLKEAFEKREKEKCQNNNLTFSLDCDFESMYQDTKPVTSQLLSRSSPNLETSHPVMPFSSSTPYKSNKALK